MRAIKILAGIVVILGLLLAGGALYVNSYVQTPEFKQEVLTRARRAVGSDVEIEGLEISLLGGVRLRHILIANPQGFRGNFLTAEEIILRPRLLPLLLKRVEIDQLSVEKPVLALVRNSRNVWNFQKLGSKTTQPDADAAAARKESSSAGTTFDIALSNLSIEDGEIEMLDGRHKLLARMQEVDLATSLDFVGDELNGSGKLSLKTLNLGDSLFVRQLSAPMTISANQVKLNPVDGRLAGGRVSGSATLNLAPDFKYALNLQVEGADVDTLLHEAGAKRTMTGKLQATAAMEGTGGLPTMTGKGRANIVRGELAQVPMQNILATLLQAPALRQIKFDECLVEFSLAHNLMRTPVIRLTSPGVRITGNGVVSLARGTLDHQLTLALSKATVGVVPKQILPVFSQANDGSLRLKFHLWGPYDAPKTDLKRRLITGTAKQLLKERIKKGLKKLFK